jgi:excisionase family DNA binding protein
VPTASPYMSPAEFAEFLGGIPRSTIYDWVRRGYGPVPYRFGKHLRFRRDEVESWIAEQRDGGDPSESALDTRAGSGRSSISRGGRGLTGVDGGRSRRSRASQ